jgi:chondroitin 4-sulfotransferase 11
MNSALPRPFRKLVWRLRHGKVSRKEVFFRDQRERGTYAFIHINKCGGTSIEQALNLPKIHDTALQRRDLIGAEAWERLKTFSIVRHPYAKVISHYNYRAKTGQTGLDDSHIGLNDWVRAAYRDRDPRYYDNPLMFAPCRDWLVDEEDRIIVDYIGKLETIAEDWMKIRELIGAKADLPVLNTTTRAGSGKARPADLLEPETRAVLDEVFARDFDSFGYDRR